MTALYRVAQGVLPLVFQSEVAMTFSTISLQAQWTSSESRLRDRAGWSFWVWQAVRPWACKLSASGHWAFLPCASTGTASANAFTCGKHLTARMLRCALD